MSLRANRNTPAWAALSALIWASCSSAPDLALPAAPIELYALPQRSPFDGWRDKPRVSFERDLAEWNPDLSPSSLTPEGLEALTASLSGMDEPAIRAALLLAHSRDQAAAEALMRRLEERVEGPLRNSDSADVVAAATLATWPKGERYGDRLVALAKGERPHPDLEVRVECAAAALARGRREVSPFLLRVLRAATPAQREDPPDWVTKPTMAWSKSRAATALSAYLGVELAFRADASYEDQLKEIAKLSAILERP